MSVMVHFSEFLRSASLGFSESFKTKRSAPFLEAFNFCNRISTGEDLDKRTTIKIRICGTFSHYFSFILT